MNNVVAFNGSPVEVTPVGLGDRLVWLTRFGKPRVGVFSDGGWRAGIEMHVADSVRGTQFEVTSDFGMRTPDAAVDQLVERMLSAISQLGGSK